ncbi:MAG: DUF5667 domain-containing protein [Actinomycetota bacterium]
MPKTNKNTMLDDAFNDCLDMLGNKGTSPTECLAKYPEMKKELEPALTAALSMKSGPAVAPDNAYRARVKERMVTTRAPGKKHAFVPGRFLYRVTAATVAFALVLGGVGYASTDSLPDSPLYPVKQLIEKIRLAVTTDNQAEVELHLQNAEERLAEADAMAEEGKTEEARQALNEMMKEMRAAYKLAGMVPGHDREILLAKFAVISQRHMLVLEGVLERAPDSAKPAIERAITDSQRGLDKASEAVMKQEKEREQETEREEERNAEDEENTEAKESGKSNGQGQDKGSYTGQSNKNKNSNTNTNTNKN